MKDVFIWKKMSHFFSETVPGVLLEFLNLKTSPMSINPLNASAALT